MTLAADIGQSVGYSWMLEQAAMPLDQAHAAFLEWLDQPDDQPKRVLSDAEKRAALLAGMSARGELAAAAAITGVSA